MSRNKLWLDGDHYIEIDSEGRCIGECPEGALGCVIQVQSHNGRFGKLALKLPRLLGETHRENAYITGIVNKELNTALTIHGKEAIKELLPITMIGPEGPFRTRINSESITDGFLLVNFEKGKKPLLCFINVKGEKYPPASPFPFTNTEELSKLLEQNKDPNTQNMKAAFFLEEIDRRNASQQMENKDFSELNAYSMTKASEIDTIGTTWALGMPSILFRWVDGTLQEALDRNEKQKWGFQQNVRFMKIMCDGIQGMHGSGFIHADIRPANIVYSEDPKNPNNYYIADYGGYGNMDSADLDDQDDNVNSLGPIVAGERYSPFYAPERRTGIERENADTVYFRYDQAGGKVYVILGWRRDIENIEIDDVIRRTLGNEQPANEQPALVAGLMRGDRIQIRDYVFELHMDEMRIDNLNNTRLLECRIPYWQIFRGKIAVAQHYDEANMLADSLPIPRLVELRQWSAATDLYGLGILALYIVYHDSQRAIAPTPSPTEIGDKFRVMADHLSHVTTLNAVWYLLEHIRYHIEETLSGVEALTPDAFVRHEIPSHNGGNIELKEEAKGIVHQFALIVPESKKVLIESFDRNIGYFVLYMHFILSCIHRMSDLKGPEQSSRYMSGRFSPYSRDRCEQPQDENRAICQANERLEKLENYCNNPYVEALQLDPEEIDNLPDIESDPFVHAKLQNAQENLAKITGVLHFALSAAGYV